MPEMAARKNVDARVKPGHDEGSLGSNGRMRQSTTTLVPTFTRS